MIFLFNYRYNLNFQILAFVIDSSIIFGGKAINNLAKFMIIFIFIIIESIGIYLLQKTILIYTEVIQKQVL